MKRICFKMYFVMLVTGFFLGGAAYAAEKAHVVLEGPDMVQAGQSVTYTVSTIGGSDTGYTWWLEYASNDCAAVQDGVLTTSGPGVAGIRVSGNDTGAVAELHVEVIPVTNSSAPGVSISGPDKVVAGSTIQLNATTGGMAGAGYFWFITYASAATGKIAKINAATGELEGIGEGFVIISAVDMGTGLSGEKTVQVVNKEEQAAVVSIAAGLGEGLTIDLMLSVNGDVPAGAHLYIAVEYDGVFHFLPGMGTAPQPFRTGPSETYFEKVVSWPVTSMPYKEYTFYAGLLNGSLALVSNLDTAAVSAGYK